MRLNYKGFYAGLVLSLFSAIILFALSITIGKKELFLSLNFDGGATLDFLFKYFTHFGDGMIWILVLIVAIFFLKRKDALPLLTSAFLLSTIFTQVLKRFVFPGEPRPIKAINENDLIHTVQGVDVHSLNSLPSGHTATAFCVYLIFCLLVPRSWWVFAGFITAFIAGYSRIYLAQHFPIDVASGIIIAIFSVWIAMIIQSYIWKKKYPLKS